MTDRLSPSKFWFISGSVILFIGLFHLLTLRPGHDWGDDFAMYIQHAKNLVERHPYADTGYIPNPQRTCFSPRAYPPVFPILLAPIYAFSGINLAAMQSLGVACFLLALLAMVLKWRRELSDIAMIGFILALGFQPYLWFFKDQILSDLPFLMFVYWTFYFFDKAYPADMESRGSRGARVAALVTMVLACGTRTIGFALPAALGLWHANTGFPKRDRLWVILTISITVVSMALTGYVVRSHSYGSDLPMDFLAIANNFGYVLRFVEIWGTGVLPITAIVMGGLSYLAMVGSQPMNRRNLRPIEFFLLVYLVVNILVPCPPMHRYLIPLLPYFLFYVFRGVDRLAEEKRKKSISASLIVLIGIAYITQYRHQDRFLSADVTSPEAVALFDFIKSRTKPTDVFIFEKPRALALYTNRRGSVSHRPTREGELVRHFKNVQATHLLVRSMGPDYMLTFIHDNQPYLKPVYETPEYKIWSIDPALYTKS